MKHLRNLILSLSFALILVVPGFAGETQAPPCVPGETAAPPCPAQSVNDDPVVPGETSSPPALPAVDVTDIAETLLWSLLLF